MTECGSVHAQGVQTDSGAHPGVQRLDLEVEHSHLLLKLGMSGAISPFMARTGTALPLPYMQVT